MWACTKFRNIDRQRPSLPPEHPDFMYDFRYQDNYPPDNYPPDNYPRTNTPRTITPLGQIPPGHLPPPEKFFKHLPWYSLYLYSSYSFLLGAILLNLSVADIRTAINGSRTSFRTTPTATLCSIFVGLPTTSACEEHFFSCFRLYATPKRLF